MSDAPPPQTVRLDKWLWQARFFKTRSLAAGATATGRLRINGRRVTKPAQSVRPGDVLTLPLGPQIRVIRILGLATRRGPAPEARALYEDLETAAPAPQAGAPLARSGRPSRDDRRIGRLSRQGRLE
ncbi:MAG: RNA-binding S4 domain-containing protein [Qingshengfaniella sp.]